MKTFFCAILCTSLIAFLPSCSGGEEKKVLSPRDSLVHFIDSMEQRIQANKSANMLDKNLANNALSAYQQFAMSYKKDSLTAWYLFRGADLASSALGIHEHALEMYDEIINNHPTFPKYPEALFLAGFISQDKMQNGERAKKYYDKLIANYPDHEFVDDAKAMMSFFGKSDEEIVKEFEKKNEEKMNK